MKAISIIGGRQHLMKAYAVNHELRKIGINHLLVDIGIHNQPYAKLTYKELNLPSPIFKLDGDHEKNNIYSIKSILNRLAEIFRKESPSIILVYGDITPSLAACYAAISAQIAGQAPQFDIITYKYYF